MQKYFLCKRSSRLKLVRNWLFYYVNKISMKCFCRSIQILARCTAKGQTSWNQKYNVNIKIIAISPKEYRSSAVWSPFYKGLSPCQEKPSSPSPRRIQNCQPPHSLTSPKKFQTWSPWENEETFIDLKIFGIFPVYRPFPYNVFVNFLEGQVHKSVI